MSGQSPRFSWATALASWLCAGAVFGAEALPWFEHGRPTRNAQQAVELLVAAASHGLDPGDYDAGSLRQAVALASTGPAPDPAALARLEETLGSAMQRYLTHLHSGRVDPRRNNAGFPAAQRLADQRRAGRSATPTPANASNSCTRTTRTTWPRRWLR